MLPVPPTIGTLHPLSERHVTVAPLLAPVSSMSGSEDPILLAALFQLVFATTPALSPAARLGPLPTKLMLTARAGGAAEATKLAVWLAVIFVKVRLGGVKVLPLRDG